MTASRGGSVRRAGRRTRDLGPGRRRRRSRAQATGCRGGGTARRRFPDQAPPSAWSVPTSEARNLAPFAGHELMLDRQPCSSRGAFSTPPLPDKSKRSPRGRAWNTSKSKQRPSPPISASSPRSPRLRQRRPRWRQDRKGCVRRHHRGVARHRPHRAAALEPFGGARRHRRSCHPGLDGRDGSRPRRRRSAQP